MITSYDIPANNKKNKLQIANSEKRKTAEFLSTLKRCYHLWHGSWSAIRSKWNIIKRTATLKLNITIYILLYTLGIGNPFMKHPGGPTSGTKLRCNVMQDVYSN